jgi:hypothetical protein
MKISDAFVKAIKAYWKGDEYDTSETFKDKKYNKKYFDSVKSEMLNKSEKIEDKMDKKKDKY